MLSFGNTDIKSFSFGSTPVNSIWFGATKVWPIVDANASISPATFNVGSGATTVTAYITDTYNHGWRLTSGGWVTPSRYIGTGTTTVTLSATANPQSTQRSATLTFTDTRTSAATTVQVYQAAAPAPSYVQVRINSGTYTVRDYNFFELDWILAEDHELSNILASDQYASPSYVGDVITWGEYDIPISISPSEYGSYKRVYYEVVALDTNGNVIQYFGIDYAEVYIPQNPAQSEYTIELPNL